MFLFLDFKDRKFMHRRFELPSILHYVAREVCFPFQDGGVEVTRFKKYILSDASRVFRENQIHTGITAFRGHDVF